MTKHLPAPCLPYSVPLPRFARPALYRWAPWLLLAGLVWLVVGCQLPAPCPACYPTPRPTATPAPVPTAVPPVLPYQSTSGRAVVRLDLTRFRPAPPLDYYAIGTLLWLPATRSPTTPALELSVRGLSAELCQRSPCGASSLGIVARWSANIAHDGNEPDEHRHCGAGVGFSRRLPVGPGPLVDIVVEWGPGFVRVSAGGSSWTSTQGAAGPGFGVVAIGVPNPPRGIGWSRSPWELQAHGGRARLVDWSGTPGGSVEACP